MFVWLDNIGIFQHTYSRPQKFSKEFTPGNLLHIRNGLEKACTCVCGRRKITVQEERSQFEARVYVCL